MSGPAEALAQAFRLQQAGRIEEAVRLAGELAQRHPKLAGAHYLLGLGALAAGDGRQALRHLERARKHGPASPPLDLATARARLAAGDRRRALQGFERLTRDHPDLAEAHYSLGGIYAEDNRVAEAAERFARTAELRPTHAEAFNNLGTTLRLLGRQAEAVAAFERAAALRPGYVRAISNLGVALIETGRHDAGLEQLERAVSLDEANASALVNLGHGLKTAGRDAEAVTVFRRLAERFPQEAELALDLGLAEQAAGNPAEAEAALRRAADLEPGPKPWFCLGELFRGGGRPEEAAAAYREALRLDPADECGATLGLSLVGAAEAPATAPESYVRSLFDGYAARFERELVGGLGYSAPSLLRETVAADGAGPGLVIMDLGCGTGLGGAAFADLAARLDGVDLSPLMVEQARARGIYAGLQVGELVAALNDAGAGRYDLVLAADVLVYIGDLAPLFRAVARAMKPGGRFAFTVEQGEEGDTWRLHEGHRYTHGRHYVESTAAAAGLALGRLDPVSTRQNKGAPVPGLLGLARRP